VIPAALLTGLWAAFDLLFNAIGSFWIATLVVALGVWALRIQPGRAARLLWSLPFAKVVWDAAHGIPEGAFFWARIAGTKQQLGSFFAGAGLHWVVPNVRFALAAITDKGRFPSTIADLVAGLLSRRVSPLVPAAIAAVVLVVALARLALRAARIVAGERARSRLAAEAEHLGDRRVGRRRVSIFVSREAHGAPFTGGLLHPYVCFPEATYARLSDGERDAALAHELAHVARRDLLLSTALDVLCDLLWFVPGTRLVRRRIDASTERLADVAAVRAGASPLDLASALVRVREAIAADTDALAAALVRPRSELGRRVAALLGEGPAARLGFGRPWAAALWTAWLAAVALSSTLAGHV
jgi:beta-lactamase regulating signal transducer with metallopeptidase domain